MKTVASTAADAPLLCPLPSVSMLDQADAMDFFGMSGLSMTSVVLGLLDQSDDCIKVISPDGSLQFMNCNGKKAMQIDDFSVLAGRPWPSLWPAESQLAVQRSMSEAREGRSHRFEAFCPTAKGDPRWWEVTVSPLHRADGSVGGILSSSRDITEQRRREEQLETVAAEMRHRLRNAHAVGAAIAMAASREAPEHRQFGLELAERLSRLADIQANLLDFDNGITVEHLCHRTIVAFDPDGRCIECDGGDDIVLGEQGARTLALVIGELATNSMKYGALGRAGRARISTSLEEDTLTVAWQESFDPGAEAPLPSPSSGQGTVLMQRMIALMDGALERSQTDNGYSVSITVPLSKVA